MKRPSLRTIGWIRSGRWRRPLLGRALGFALGFALAFTVLMAAPAAQAHEYYTLGFKLIHPWADATAPDATDAPVYFKLESVVAADRLLRASTPQAESVEFRHAAPNGASATPRNSIDFDTAEAIDFGPGQSHLVLRGLKSPLLLGRSYMMAMTFEKAGTLLVMISVGAH